MLIGTDSLIKSQPGAQQTLTKLVEKLVNKSALVTVLIMTNYSVIILKRIFMCSSLNASISEDLVSCDAASMRQDVFKAGLITFMLPKAFIRLI